MTFNADLDARFDEDKRIPAARRQAQVDETWLARFEPMPRPQRGDPRRYELRRAARENPTRGDK